MESFNDEFRSVDDAVKWKALMMNFILEYKDPYQLEMNDIVGGN